jgi:hypothetical protein
MKPSQTASLETQLLVELVARIKSVNTIVGQEAGEIDLKCPCGVLILPPTPVISNLKERQRGLVKSRIKRHLGTDHRMSEATIRVVLNEAFGK